MTTEMLPVFMFIFSLLAIIMGVHVAFALAGSAVIFGLIGLGPSLFKLYVIATFDVFTTYSLIAVGLFIFMGSLLESSGITERLYEVLHIALGGFKGGLAVATIIICILFGACTGVVGASIVTMAFIALPGMLSKGYNKALAAGTVMAGGCLGMVIPPSIMLILYGSVSGTSIPKLFVAGIVPGIALGIMYVVFISILCIVKPEWGPTITREERATYSFAMVGKTLLTGFVPVMTLIILVLGSIFAGICAPTEAAGIGGLGGIILCAAYGKLKMEVIKKACIMTVRTVAMVLLIVLGAKYFIATFTSLGGGEIAETLISPFIQRPGLLLFVLVVILFFLGMFMDWIGLIYVFVPILNPIIASLGLDPVWYGMIFCLALCVSLMTPPFAYAVFYLKGAAPAEMTIMDMYKGCLPFLAFQILIIVLIYIFPGLVTWLPSVWIG
jgi:tripartite ATP-independent transporter DctM subunit